MPRLSSLQELLSLSELAHYHLVRLYGVSPNGSISIVSEFVPGGPLDAYLQDNAATVSGGDMLSYALQVAKVSAVGRWVRQEVDGAGGKRGEAMECLSAAVAEIPISNCSSIALNGCHQYPLVVA